MFFSKKLIWSVVSGASFAGSDEASARTAERARVRFMA
jgi:hypothetical protein